MYKNMNAILRNDLILMNHPQQRGLQLRHTCQTDHCVVCLAQQDKGIQVMCYLCGHMQLYD